jgi:hypothetical protein
VVCCLILDEYTANGRIYLVVCCFMLDDDIPEFLGLPSVTVYRRGIIGLA